MPNFWSRVERHRHVFMLVVAMVGLTLQPLAHWPTGEPMAYEIFAYSLLLAVFLAIFQSRPERIFAVIVAVPGIIANIIEEGATGRTKIISAMTYHSLSVLFVGVAVVVILRGVFRRGKVGLDEFAGAFCGYILAGVAFGNVYTMVDILTPGAFHIPDAMQWQLESDETRRSLFNYYSFTTLTTMGYGDITPQAPIAYTLAWLEAMFGQFYLAVLIGQLIGLKLAQAPTAHAAKHS
jgi:hypothetical protein